ncbi:MAG: hypothetical protein KDD55_00015 [Bdellovibrionales bacterium]|nr:hypothetical protein [Bdellovibrionales bacterium]
MSMNLDHIAGYEIGSAQLLTSEQKKEILSIIQNPLQRQHQSLEGRASVRHADVQGLGKIVVKSYRRGGLLRYFVSSYYIRYGQSRAYQEFDLMNQFRALGGHAPEPLCYVNLGSLFYRTWLVTREVETHYTLAQLSRHAPELVHQAVQNLVRQVNLLIEHKIFHVDLHPGNVLVQQTGAVYLVDFDKAHRYLGNAHSLRQQYLRRWRRAVIKHELPDDLSELFCGGILTSSHD